MWKKWGVMVATFVVGYAIGGVINSSKHSPPSKLLSEDLTEGYPKSIEWLAPATDANPNPTRKSIEFTQALE